MTSECLSRRIDRDVHFRHRGASTGLTLLAGVRTRGVHRLMAAGCLEGAMPQTVFNVKSSGGVLIVAPVGDALGFRESDVLGDIDSVLTQIRALTPPLVVIDLAGSGYFGSVIIGALVSFTDVVEETGGALAVCNVSEQMREVFKVMRLDQRWDIRGTRREAIRAVRKASS